MTCPDPDCDACHGAGRPDPTGPEACPWCWPVECSTCGGTGEILIGARFFPCPDCEEQP